MLTVDAARWDKNNPHKHPMKIKAKQKLMIFRDNISNSRQHNKMVSTNITTFRRR